MVRYRAFRNPDPPSLAKAWNEIFTGRGAVRLAGTLALEQYVFSKQIFRPDGFILAIDDEAGLVGFVHAALGAPIEGAAKTGVICLLGVRPAFRRRGIGSELLRAGEDYLKAQGVSTVQVGGYKPNNPFYQGLYGGCETSGVLASDSLAEPFLLKRGYRVVEKIGVFQRRLSQKLNLVDPRFPPLRNRFELHAGTPRVLQSWWKECCVGTIDPVELVVMDRTAKQPAARCLAWDMDGFSQKWSQPSVGILDFDVTPAYRRQGLGKLFLTQLMKQFQEQFFEIVEIHLNEQNAPAVQFLSNLQFAKADVGQVFLRELGPA